MAYRMGDQPRKLVLLCPPRKWVDEDLVQVPSSTSLHVKLNPRLVGLLLTGAGGNLDIWPALPKNRPGCRGNLII